MSRKFEVLAKARINDNREAVISRTDKEEFTLAQKLIVTEGNKEIGVFLKESVHIKGMSEMIALRNALNLAIHLLGNKEEENI